MSNTSDFGEKRRTLVAELKAEGILKSEQVIAAMEIVPRELFVPDDLKAHAYEDVPLPIEHGQTISAPHDPVPTGRATHGRHNG